MPVQAWVSSREARRTLASWLVAPARQHDGQVRGVKVSGATGRAGADGVVLRARRGVGSDVPGPWQGRRQARIAQRLDVGELEPEPCVLGVSGGFHHLAKRTKKSTMWKPRTLRRSVGSRPTRGQRSACTSSPRRPRTARWKGAGPVYVVSVPQTPRGRTSFEAARRHFVRRHGGAVASPPSVRRGFNDGVYFCQLKVKAGVAKTSNQPTV